MTLRWLRPLLIVPLLYATVGAEASASPVYGSCGFVGNQISCGGAEENARWKARSLTADQARSIGCEPLYWEGVDEPPPMPVLGSRPVYPEQSPDPAVANRVNLAWERIEGWLGSHASATLRGLKPGAEPQSLASHGRLPDDFYVSYLRHDGADGFLLPPGYGLLDGGDTAMINWIRCSDLVMDGDLSAADPERGTWHGSLLAFGSDAQGNELFVEPRTGRVGVAETGEPVRYDGPLAWPSYLALLEATATALDGGEAVRDWYPVVSSGCELRWAEEPAPLPTGCAGAPRLTPTPRPVPREENE